MPCSYLEAEREKIKRAKSARAKKLAASPTTAIAVAGAVDPDEDKIGIVSPSIHSYIAAIQRDARNLICTFRKVEKKAAEPNLLLEVLQPHVDPDEPIVSIIEANGTTSVEEHEEQLTSKLIG